jgi:GNAT superfamily N-acetyltransferase
VDDQMMIRELTEADVPAAQEIMKRSVLEDLGETYDPATHADIGDLHDSHLHTEGAFMLVVEDTASGDLVATGGIRSGALGPDDVPAHLALLERRYRDGRTGQIVRVHVRHEHRRRGIARALVQEIISRVNATALYERLALQTHPYSPGALPFWQAMGFAEVLDDIEYSRRIFFELP